MGDVTRRDFMKIAGWAAAVTSFSAVTVPLIAYLYPKDLSETPADPVMVADASAFPVGEARVVQFGRYPALIIHTSDGLRAYSAVCTHFACIVKWNAETGEIECPCHEGYFDPADGSVLAGPPPTPLAALDVYTEGGQVYVAAPQEDAPQ